jgi:hypothetical protein
MRQLAFQLSNRQLAPRGLVAAPRPGRKLFTAVNAFKKDGKNGIHDPAGPAGSWGAGENKARLERQAQEEGFRVENEDLHKKDIRADQKSGHHPPGHSTVDRPAAVSKELKELDEEKADEDYEHLSKIQKKLMEVKNALYSFLKSGYEPL